MNIDQSNLPTEKDIANYELLTDMLSAQKQEFDLLSNKKADVQLNPTKIKIVNRVLEPLKEILQNEPAYKFLDILDEVVLPTNSDVVLIISQYETAIREFKHNYYLEDKYKSTTYNSVFRWMTKEFPPDYYKNREV